ncbi:hypothetical protein KDRO_C08340 [Kluyveromyces lactis]|nr:hypothetical protein KDRO_C08340 [Kluyveromyces lactis]
MHTIHAVDSEIGMLYSISSGEKDLSKRSSDLLENVGRYTENLVIDLNVLREIQVINDTILKSEAFLEAVVVQNGGENPVFQYLHDIETKSKGPFDLESRSIMQDIVYKTVSSRFEFNKIWLPKFFLKVPKSFSAGVILQEQFLISLWDTLDDNMFLTFVNVCCSMLREVSYHEMVALLRLITEYNTTRDLKEVCAVIFQVFSDTTDIVGNIIQDLDGTLYHKTLTFIGYLISGDSRFITLLFLEQCDAIVPNMENIRLLQELLIDLNISAVPLPNHLRSLKLSSKWYTFGKNSLFWAVFKHLNSDFNKAAKQLAYQIVVKIFESSGGRIVALWNGDLQTVIPRSVSANLAESIEIKYIGSLYGTLKLLALTSGIQYIV